MIIDIGIIIMLLLTMGFCVKLNSKIIEIQKSKKELANILKQFETSIKKAETMIDKLKRLCKETADYTDVVIDNANYQKQLNDASKKHVSKLDNLVSEAKSVYTQMAEMKKSVNYILQNTQLNQLSIKSNRMDWNKKLNIERDLSIGEVDQGNKETKSDTSGLTNQEKDKMVAIESLLQKISEQQKTS